ncbi:hypothetical protein [Granulicella arctica]|uniref:Uncharacterized protein n=1 Tax=Granulicella arctica TaxID=940613 RepID=A0A7Y9PEM4_9BACT|nr:hypothetical protein [Granulicella arctica]NYF78284.1 hypothetical protein [Granulicella arctica]
MGLSSFSGYLRLQLFGYVRARRTGWVVAAAVVGALAGCRGDTPYVVPTGPMPANTVLLSQMMQELSARPGFTEAMLAQLNDGSKRGPALLTPKLIDHMRQLILGKDWQGLNRFPGWTMREINPTVRVVSRVAGGAASTKDLAAYVDLGPYALERAERVDLDVASDRPGFSTVGLTSALGDGVVRGDGADPAIAPMHAESQRLAEVLNRLALNGLDGAAVATASVDGRTATTPEAMMQSLVASGHEVVVSDARYFANFGHFHSNGQDVMMPFWVNSQILVPHTRRALLVPVSHAEYEWTVRGPKINADVAWYFGIDGKAEFRTMDELNQPWVLGRYAHTYRGADAVEVTRLTGRMMVAYAHLHQAHPELPFGGYYALGVCQDSVAAIEKKMTGKATLFPNTADDALFDDARDAEVNALIAAIPKDRTGRMPEPERIFGSLPTTELAAITIPGLTADLVSVQEAWQDGTLRRTHGREHWIVVALEIAGFVLAMGVAFWLWRRSR